VAHLLLSDGNEGGEEVDNAFHVAEIPAFAKGEFIMQRVETMLAGGVKNDQVFLAPAGFCVLKPVAGFFSLGCKHESAGIGNRKQAMG